MAHDTVKTSQEDFSKRHVIAIKKADKIIKMLLKKSKIRENLIETLMELDTPSL